MKKILVIENDNNLNEDNHDTLLRRLENLKTQFPEHVVTILTGLNSYSPNELFGKLIDTDILLCMPTFTDQSQASGIVSLLSKVNKCLSIHIISYDVEESLKRICTPEQLYNVRHHKVYKSFYTDEKLLDFSSIWGPWEKQKIVEQHYITSRKNNSTGRKVKVLDIQTTNKEFSLLKNGQIVEELDCREIDPDPKRGIWVWGITEPVKLLDDSGYNEFEIVEGHDLKLEITLEEMIILIKKSIKNIPVDESLSKEQKIFLIELLTEEISNQDKAWEIVDFFKLERRGNRQMFLQMLNKYKSKSLEKVA